LTGKAAKQQSSKADQNHGNGNGNGNQR